jgi:hypothetical protein
MLNLQDMLIGRTYAGFAFAWDKKKDHPAERWIEFDVAGVLLFLQFLSFSPFSVCFSLCFQHHTRDFEFSSPPGHSFKVLAQTFYDKRVTSEQLAADWLQESRVQLNTDPNVFSVVINWCASLSRVSLCSIN